MHLFDPLRENALGAHEITYAGHYEKSSCSTNEPCCHLRKKEAAEMYFDPDHISIGHLVIPDSLPLIMSHLV